MLIAFLFVLCWLGCGLHEVLTDHQWWHRSFRETHDWPALPVKLWDRAAKQNYMLGPIACIVGYTYRWGVDRTNPNR